MDLESITVLSGAISTIVGWIKNAVPDTAHVGNAIVIKRKNGKKWRIKDALLWPLLTGLIGAGVFVAVQYNLLGVGDDIAGQLLSGVTVGGSGGSAWYHGSKIAKAGVNKITNSKTPCEPAQTDTTTSEV